MDGSGLLLESKFYQMKTVLDLLDHGVQLEETGSRSRITESLELR